MKTPAELRAHAQEQIEKVLLVIDDYDTLRHHGYGIYQFRVQVANICFDLANALEETDRKNQGYPPASFAAAIGATIVKLESKVQFLEAEVRHLRAKRVMLEAEVKSCKRALEAVRALHQRVHHRPEDMESGDWCGGCGRDWPCPTITALSDEGKP